MITTKWTNYHSHTNYCDGLSSPEDYIKQALQLDLLAYGFSSHAPLPFECSWCMKQEDLHSYFETISALKNKYKNDIQIYCGLEVDFIPGIAGPTKSLSLNENLDYIVGSIHFVNQFKDGKRWEIDNNLEIFEKGLKEIFHGDIREAIKSCYELTRMMVAEETPDIIGHLDKIKMHNTENKFFSEDEEWYKIEILKTLAAIKESGAIIEVNTRGSYKGKTTDFYPSNWVLKEIKNMEIPITLSSDAHKVEEIILGFPKAVNVLHSLGFKNKMIHNNKEWKMVPL